MTWGRTFLVVMSWQLCRAENFSNRMQLLPASPITAHEAGVLQLDTKPSGSVLGVDEIRFVLVSWIGDPPGCLSGHEACNGSSR